MKRFRCKRTPDGGLMLSTPAAAYLKREMANRISRSAVERFVKGYLFDGDVLSTTYSLRVDVARSAGGYVYIQFKTSEPMDVESKQRKPRQRARLRADNS